MFKNGILTVMVSDMTRALAFYAETLGFERGAQYGNEWAEVRTAGLRIGLHPGGKPPLKEHSRHYTVGLEVDDLDAVKQTLESRGVKFTAAPSDRGIRLAYFTDPDGNPLYLAEMKWG
jgi:catechol 2,3-dioxygenase-like lactoylglutathione lyase family enzyme